MYIIDRENTVDATGVFFEYSTGRASVLRLRKRIVNVTCKTRERTRTIRKIHNIGPRSRNPWAYLLKVIGPVKISRFPDKCPMRKRTKSSPLSATIAFCITEDLRTEVDVAINSKGEISVTNDAK